MRLKLQRSKDASQPFEIQASRNDEALATSATYVARADRTAAIDPMKPEAGDAE
jgi:uncharacterized protein YegP (UPF0339 family)